MSAPLPFTVPDRVARRAATLLGTVPAARWCAALPVRVAAVVERLELCEVQVWDRGRGGWLLRAVSPSGPVVLKAPFVDPGAHFDAAEVLALAGVGPAVLWRDDLVAVLELLDAVPLAELPDPVAHLVPLVHRLARLARSGHPAVAALPSLSGWLGERVAASPVDCAPASVEPDPAQRDAAAAALEVLSTHPEGPCHGDVNLGNVLVDAAGGVWLIDARGVRGDVHYDVATVAYKVCGDQGRAAGLAAELAAAAGLDPARSAAWVPVVVTARV